MKFIAHPDGRFDSGQRTYRCALGRAGVKTADQKREGDGASPIGVWPIRKVLYRPDKFRDGAAPQTALPLEAIARDDGWCDDPEDKAYNRPIKLPFMGSFEKMWRDDHLYDIVVVLGHNDDPPKPYFGSCIFMHLAKEGYLPTEGCVALTRADLEAVLKDARPGDVVEIAAD